MAGLLETAPYITGEWVSTWVEYNRRDLLLYAVGIGCEELKFVYEQAPDFAAFPTYPVVLSFKGATSDVDTPAGSDRYLGKSAEPLFGGGPPLPWLPGARVVVDAERYVERLKEIPAMGARMILRTRLMGIHKRGSGGVVETESELLGEDGTKYYRFVSGGFQIGARDFKDAGTSGSQKVEPPARAPDAVVEMAVPTARAHVYRLSGTQTGRLQPAAHRPREPDGRQRQLRGAHPAWALHVRPRCARGAGRLRGRRRRTLPGTEGALCQPRVPRFHPGHALLDG